MRGLIVFSHFESTSELDSKRRHSSLSPESRFKKFHAILFCNKIRAGVMNYLHLIVHSYSLFILCLSLWQLSYSQRDATAEVNLKKGKSKLYLSLTNNLNTRNEQCFSYVISEHYIIIVYLQTCMCYEPKNKMKAYISI